MSSETSVEESVQPQQREPTIIFLFDLKNWFEVITPLSKLDLLDIVPSVATQFYMDFGIKAYVLMLIKSKWDNLPEELKRKFMLISRRIKEEMEGPMQTVERERYENADIFKLLMGGSPPPPVNPEQSAELPSLDPIPE